MLLSAGPKYNRLRPAVDPLFLSAARWYGSSAVGIVLSGALDDGAAGLAAIVAGGGDALVQDPGDAAVPDMPQAALAVVPQAVTCGANAMGNRLTIMLQDRPASVQPTDGNADIVWETDVMNTPITGGPSPVPGRPAAFGCPDCGGGMNITTTGTAIQLWCHVGHGWSPQALLTAQHEKTEQALWTAVSILEEQATLHRTIAEQAALAEASMTARHQHTAATEAINAADTIRKMFPDLVYRPDDQPNDYR
jgi:two-component system, chemotaxis family, protein-glutamate methylesterase/glutaminase